jgi:hypothetical protein
MPSTKNGAAAVDGPVEVLADGTTRRNDHRKQGTTRGSPRRTSTAKASGISGHAAKSGCACEWDGGGRVSVDGLGQENPDRSEDLWGRGDDTWHGSAPPSPWFRHRAGRHLGPRSARRTDANRCVEQGQPGAGLTCATRGKALSERPTLQPYWGKPAVRNDRVWLVSKNRALSF